MINFCEEHIFCFGSEPLESRPWAEKGESETTQMEAVPITDEPSKIKSTTCNPLVGPDQIIKTATGIKIVRNKNPLLPNEKIIVTERGMDSWQAQTYGYTLDTIPVVRPEHMPYTIYEKLKKYAKCPIAFRSKE